ALPSTVAETTQQVRSPRPRPCPDLALRQPSGQWAHEPSTMQPNRPPHRDTVSEREDVRPVGAVFHGIPSGGRGSGHALNSSRLPPHHKPRQPSTTSPQSSPDE